MWTRTGIFRCDDTHHDGTNHYLYRVYKDNISEAQKDRLKRKNLQRHSHQGGYRPCHPRLGDEIGKVYGWNFPAHQKSEVRHDEQHCRAKVILPDWTIWLSTEKYAAALSTAMSSASCRRPEGSLYHGEPLCVVLYRDRNGKTISRAFLNDLDTLPKGLFVEDSSRRKPEGKGEATMRGKCHDREV